MSDFKKLRSVALGTAFIAAAKAVVVIDEVKKSEKFKRVKEAVDELVARVNHPEATVKQEPTTRGGCTLDDVMQHIDALARMDEERKASEPKFESVFSFLGHSVREMTNSELCEYLKRALNIEIAEDAAELIRVFVLRAGVQYTNIWAEPEEPAKVRTMGDFFRSMVGREIDNAELLKIIYRHMGYHKTTFFISNFDLDIISTGCSTQIGIDTLIKEHQFDDYMWVDENLNK